VPKNVERRPLRGGRQVVPDNHSSAGATLRGKSDFGRKGARRRELKKVRTEGNGEKKDPREANKRRLKEKVFEADDINSSGRRKGCRLRESLGGN